MTRHILALKVADGLSLAATPTFAIMALLAGMSGSTHGVVVHSGWAAGEMSLMYLLMSIFHAAPWLRDRVVPTGTGEDATKMR